MAVLILLFVLSLSFSKEVRLLKPSEAALLALEKNRDILRLRQEILSLEDIYRAEKWDRFSPKLDLIVDEEGTSLFTRMLLLDFGNRLARIRSAEINAGIKKELLRELEREVKIKVVKLFMDIALAEKLAEVKREEMAVAYVRFDRERERLERGLSDRVEVARWELTYRRFRAELLQAQRRYNETIYELKRFLGLDVDEEIALDFSELTGFEVPAGLTINTAYLLERVKNNYLLRAKRLEAEYFESRAKEERRILYPELFAYFDLRKSFEEGGGPKGTGSLILRVPLFDGRTSSLRELSFLDLKRAVEIEARDIEERLKRDILSAPYRWDEIVGGYERSLAFDNWAQENLDLSRSNYELELAFDLGYAMSTKTQAEMELMESKFRIILFLMRLYRLVGMDPLEVLKGDIPFFTEKVEEL